ncbi:MAG: Stp1/IreP family PP2C-type Ser/Thr phosphatase [Lachnospiraceae bacterium]
MNAYGLSDVGCVRRSNQDSIFYTTESIGNLPNLCIVADGMGGHKAGELASSMAVDEFVKHAKQNDSVNPVTIMKQGLAHVNRIIKDKAVENPDYEGMGTTFVASVYQDGQLYVANIGDSRLYLIEDTIRQITIDHSLVQQLVLEGKIKPEEARNHPEKNIITRAVGVKNEVEADFFQVESNGKVMLCSDGLSNMLTNEEIFDIVKEAKDNQDAVEKLVEQARYYGGKDNISVILFER